MPRIVHSLVKLFAIHIVVVHTTEQSERIHSRELAVPSVDSSDQELLVVHEALTSREERLAHVLDDVAEAVGVIESALIMEEEAQVIT